MHFQEDNKFKLGLVSWKVVFYVFPDKYLIAMHCAIGMKSILKCILKLNI